MEKLTGDGKSQTRDDFGRMTTTGHFSILQPIADPVRQPENSLHCPIANRESESQDIIVIIIVSMMHCHNSWMTKITPKPHDDYRKEKN